MERTGLALLKKEGKYVMLCRVETPSMKQLIWPADSVDGINFELRPDPIRMPDDDEFKEYDGEVKIYYGGADTVQCLATAKLDDLIDACFNR